eukprot:5632629-Pleurochrysis_carterae.AAC.3
MMIASIASPGAATYPSPPKSHLARLQRLLHMQDLWVVHQGRPAARRGAVGAKRRRAVGHCTAAAAAAAAPVAAAAQGVDSEALGKAGGGFGKPVAGLCGQGEEKGVMTVNSASALLSQLGDEERHALFYAVQQDIKGAEGLMQLLVRLGIKKLGWRLAVAKELRAMAVEQSLDELALHDRVGQDANVPSETQNQQPQPQPQHAFDGSQMDRVPFAAAQFAQQTGAPSTKGVSQQSDATAACGSDALWMDIAEEALLSTKPDPEPRLLLHLLPHSHTHSTAHAKEAATAASAAALMAAESATTVAAAAAGPAAALQPLPAASASASASHSASSPPSNDWGVELSRAMGKGF